MNLISDYRTRTSWKTYESTYDTWGSLDTDVVPDLPTERDEAQEVIAIGMEDYACPFAWIIEDI